jgi:nucleoside-diphosphate-sugar epimerase
MLRVLIVGFGDVARRLVPHLLSRYRVYGLVRNPGQAGALRELGVVPIQGDLDIPASLGKLSGLADIVIHLAPPPSTGGTDTRTRNLLAAIAGRNSHIARPQNRGMLPHRLIYISTTGVYGNCHGDWVDETRTVNPESSRAVRRVDAEAQVREWGARTGSGVSILRVPGIYAGDRLPLERLEKRLPALREEEDGWSNHIHADDLARVIAASMTRGRPNRVYNCVDDSALKMGGYFDLVADRLSLPRPPRITRAEAETQVSEAMLSFMRESRRIRNGRMKYELRIRLRYPTVAHGIA